MGILSDLLTRLKEGEVTFEFRTSSGRIRRARGTLSSARIPKEDWSKGKKLRQPPPKTDEYSVRARRFQPYYDIDKGEWRRFKVFALTRIIQNKPILGNVNSKRISDDELDL